MNALRAFESAGRCGSFAAAAEELFVTPAAISHQVRTLEEALGLELFVRTARGATLSAAGRKLLPSLTQAFDQVGQAVDSLPERPGGQPLVISAGPAFASLWLAPRLHRFTSRHPGLEVRVAADLQFADFDRECVDAAIRFGQVKAGEGFFVERLVEEAVAPMCTPELARRLQQPADLVGVPLVRDGSLKAITADAPGWPEWAAAAGVQGLVDDKALAFNQADHALQAAMGGAGVVLGRCVLARPALTSGQLVVPFGPRLSTGLWFHWMCRAQDAGRDDLLQLRTWLNEELDEVRSPV